MPLSGFQSRMTVLQADSNFHFIQEYEGVTVPEEDTYSTEVALSMVNAPKNRYTNIIPCRATSTSAHVSLPNPPPPSPWQMSTAV